jgi:hypothetical protein
MRRTIELWNGNDVAAEIGDIDKGEMQRCLLRRDRADTAFAFADSFLEHRGRRIGDTAVAKAF